MPRVTCGPSIRSSSAPADRKTWGRSTSRRKNSASTSARRRPPRALAWEKDYPSAITKAKAEKKPLMIMMTATWCGPCKMLEKETLDDPWVRYFLSNFVVVKAYEDKA